MNDKKRTCLFCWWTPVHRNTLRISTVFVAVLQRSRCCSLKHCSTNLQKLQQNRDWEPRKEIEEQQQYRYLEETLNIKQQFVKKKSHINRVDPNAIVKSLVEGELNVEEESVSTKVVGNGEIQNAWKGERKTSKEAIRRIVQGNHCKNPHLELPSSQTFSTNNRLYHSRHLPTSYLHVKEDRKVKFLALLLSPFSAKEQRKLKETKEALEQMSLEFSFVFNTSDADEESFRSDLIQDLGVHLCLFDRDWYLFRILKNQGYYFSCGVIGYDKEGTEESLNHLSQIFPICRWEVMFSFPQFDSFSLLHHNLYPAVSNDSLRNGSATDGRPASSSHGGMNLSHVTERYSDSTLNPQTKVTETNETPQRNESNSDDEARIVLNHSTHIPGLLKALKLLSQQGCVQTIIPGRLKNGKSRSPHLILRITTITSTGYKLLARKGSTVQEVFLVTSSDRHLIEEILQKINKRSKQ